MLIGYLLQVMDFALNFNYWYQDEVQSAYWCGTQMTIHATINFFLCPRGCKQLVSTFSKNRDQLNIVTIPFHCGEKHTNSTG